MAPKPTRPLVEERYQPREIPLNELYLDSKNPRIVETLGRSPSQADIAKHLWTEAAVDELAFSIATNGYQRYEPLFAVKEGGKLVVIEGNRRLAAVLILRDAKLRRQIGISDLPSLTVTINKTLDTLPVIECERSKVWQYIGFKHVNGPQVWQSYAKAQYIKWVHDEQKISLETIAERIGDRNQTVERLYRGITILEQAEEAGMFKREQRAKKRFAFSHLYTALDYPGFQEYLGLKSPTGMRDRVPRGKLGALAEVCVWLYGDSAANVQPVIQSQNPDLRHLDAVLQSEDGVTALRKGLPLSAAREVAQGEAQVLRNELIVAKTSLAKATGVRKLGYHGEKDLLRLASEILELAEELVESMEATPQRRERRR